MKKDREPTYSFDILTLVLIVVDTVLAALSIAILPGKDASGASIPGVSLIYVAVAFMILFTLWFGAYGAIAAYAGTLIGGGILHAIPPAVAILWSIAGLLQVLIPLVAFRAFEVDPALGNRRDWTYLLIFGVLINNIIGAGWGAATLAIGEVIRNDQIGSVFSAWLLGNIIVTLIILPIALTRLTPKVQRSKLFVKHYWN